MREGVFNFRLWAHFLASFSIACSLSFAASADDNWISERWEAPQKSDYFAAVALAGTTGLGYGILCAQLNVPVETTTGIVIFQTLLVGTETAFMRFLDNLTSNRPKNQAAKFSKKTEFSIRVLRHLANSEGLRWISGPIMGASAIDTWAGQQQILLNVAAYGSAHAMMSLSRSRNLSLAGGRFANIMTFTIIGGLASIDLMGAHLFNIPVLSDYGIHGSNLLIWITGGIGAILISKFPKQVDRMAEFCASSLQWITRIRGREDPSKNNQSPPLPPK